MTAKKKPAPAAPPAIRCLERVLARRKNQRALTAALQKALLEDGYQFFKTVILPLLPKPLKMPETSTDNRDEPLWTPLSDIIPTLRNPKSTPPATTDSAPSAAAGDSGKPSALPPS